MQFILLINVKMPTIVGILTFISRINTTFEGFNRRLNLLCFFCLVFAMPLYASVYMCLVVTCWERADLLALFCGVLL